MPTTSSTSPMDITRAVIASFDRCESERLRRIMESLAAHVHAFATDVELTQDEWEAGIRILTETGHITDDRRQDQISRSRIRTSVRSWPRLTSSRRVVRSALR